ncbi:transglycosylase domain-containing protein [Thaumasiovibrio subtropicus]|uniref:transglycosylase domain-containing protein n=1 Tax=Thaumasiovibrio subtropicus TaxID=1891207 RepID=UPI00131E279D|nr:transglycosylase domain-containing protein [Thaumasiovibrio subtropicus]
MLKKIFLILTLTGICVGGTTMHIIKEARNYTEDVILTDLAKGHWRGFDKKPMPIITEFSELPDRWQEWLIQIEDPGFYRHTGVDLDTPGAGLTTITQSLVKRLYFAEFTPGLKNKIIQSIIAKHVVNDMISKPAQLSLFLNAAYLGHLDGHAVIGFEDAAFAYFEMPLAALSDEQYLALVAMLIAPNHFSITKHPQENHERVTRIKRVLNGEYSPQGLTDLYYDICNPIITDCEAHEG